MLRPTFSLTAGSWIPKLLSMTPAALEVDAPSSVLARIRARLNKHPIVTALGMLAVVGAIIFWAIRDPSGGVLDGDFIDEQTGEAFVRSIDQIPPLIGAQGKATLVRAYYSAAREGQPRQLLYLQKYSDATKAYLEQYLREHRTGRPQFPDPQTAILVRAPEPGSPWVPLETPQGRKLAPDLWR